MRRGHGGACPFSAATQNHSFVSQAGGHVCCVTEQTCPLCHAADIAALSRSKHVCCVTQQTRLMCHTANMSAMSHSRHVCCVTQQTCLLQHTADMSLCHTAESSNKVITFLSGFREQSRCVCACVLCSFVVSVVVFLAATKLFASLAAGLATLVWLASRNV